MTATVQPAPVVPPRPSRKSPDKDTSSASMPKVPPRPARKLDRAVSPNPERFAPSPFHEGNFSKNEPALLSPSYSIHEPVEDPIERAGSVPMPSVGEEGVEYSAVQEEIQHKAEEQQLNQGPASPEHTSTVAEDLHLHAPKPSLPADSAKQRVQVVTRTDSDRAASFGIGRAASRDGIKKKPSTSLSTGSDNETPLEEEHGIPEIGKRVPMNPHLGDVQAPSFPDNDAPNKGHQRKHSSRGLPPGSYGLHGHGVGPQDKLQKAYYEKNPDALKRDEYTPIHDSQNNYAMTSAELNKLVRDTASRGAGVGTSSEYRSTPTDEVGFQASEEYANRIATPRPTSSAANGKTGSSTSTRPEIVLPEGGKDTDDGAIHVDDPSHPEYRHPSADEKAIVDTEEYPAPILAADEVASDSRAYYQKPAVHPPPARVGSAFEMDDAPSRPTSRPVSMHQETQPEIRTTPLDDVEEYEPLFPEGKDNEHKKKERADDSKSHRPFPSKDIWEDAPESVHYTAAVSTPDVPEPQNDRSRSSGSRQDRPLTPAHAFALKQEQLAEQEAEGGRAKGLSPTFLPSPEQKQSPWNPHLAHLRSEVKPERPSSGHRFPSRDVWEDVPESHVYEATIESPQDEPKPEESNPDEDSKTEEATPSVPARPARKSPESSERPVIPSRPKPKQNPSDEKQRPAVSEKPKPQIPARPSKGLSGDSKDGEAPKAKPPVPSRPAGGKIAALQAGFMSDLNKRLQLGPQAPKKEEAPAPEAVEEKEKVPLSDARKGRARGPQRRAPAKSPAPATAIATETKTAPALTLSLSSSISVWSISPDVGDVHVKGEEVDKPQSISASDDTTTEVPVKSETRSDTLAAPGPEPVKDESKEKLDEETEIRKADTTEIGTTEADNTEVETKTLAANTAGESILEATVEKTAEGSEVEPLTVKDEVKP